MGVRYFCPRCGADLLSYLRAVAQVGECPTCGAALDKKYARFAFVKFELQQGFYIGFLAALVSMVLLVGMSQWLFGPEANMAYTVAVPGGIIYVVAMALYYVRAFRSTPKS